SGDCLRTESFDMKSTVLCLLALCLITEAKIHNVSVTGTITCGKHRQRDVFVELMERDFSPVNPDDLLARVHTDVMGEFRLTGSTEEMGQIEPYLRVTHTCGVKEGCTRVTEFPIPDEFVNGATYEMSYVVLDIIQKSDTENCDDSRHLS
ncbi:hypothetical protein PENTCL1PPCAC_30542, partial [Pristionchus entomophagus]